MMSVKVTREIRKALCMCVCIYPTPKNVLPRRRSAGSDVPLGGKKHKIKRRAVLCLGTPKVCYFPRVYALPVLNLQNQISVLKLHTQKSPMENT